MIFRTAVQVYIVTGLFLFVSFSIADEEPRKNIAFSAIGSMQFGEVVGGKYVSTGKSKEIGPGKIYLPETRINLKWETTHHDRLRIVLQPELQIWSPTFVERWAQNELGSWRPAVQYTLAIQNGFAQYSLGDAKTSPLSITIGKFLFKYNTEAVNLGEFLFRSGAYPGYLTNEIDFPCAQLTGLRFCSTLFGSLRQDLLLTIEDQIEPLHDVSVSYLVRYGLGKFMDLGAGISLWRVLPADDSTTTPRLMNQYLDNIYLNSSGDTCSYSFSGTKLMARTTFDIKPLFGTFFGGIMGKEDLKIFGEAAVLGLNDYLPYKDTILNADPNTGVGDSVFIRVPGYYDSLLQRIPVMFGINLPAFKLLDVFALQFEYYGSRWPNNFYRKRYDYIVWAVPGTGTGTSFPDKNPYAVSEFNYHRDDWKWTVYLKKTITEGFSLRAQIARDHIRHRMESQSYLLEDETEMLSKPSHWYWMMKAQYEF